MIIEAALFDMDGLLLDSERLFLGLFEEICVEMEQPDARAWYLRMVGNSNAQTRALLAEMLGSEAAVAHVLTQWDTRARQRLHESVPIKPGAVELLERLSHLPKALVTSSQSAHAREMLTKAGLLGHFKALIGGDMVARPKPDPLPYLMGAEALGVEIGCCAAFEDSNTGIRAAVASGARAVQVPDLVPPTAEIRALGHVIAPDLLSGARAIELI